MKKRKETSEKNGEEDAEGRRWGQMGGGSNRSDSSS